MCDDLIYDRIRKNIKHLRTKNKYSQQELAKAICVSRPVIANIETGYQNPTLICVVRICNFFNVPIGELLNENKE